MINEMETYLKSSNQCMEFHTLVQRHFPHPIVPFFLNGWRHFAGLQNGTMLLPIRQNYQRLFERLIHYDPHFMDTLDQLIESPHTAEIRGKMEQLGIRSFGQWKHPHQLGQWETMKDFYFSLVMILIILIRIQIREEVGLPVIPALYKIPEQDWIYSILEKDEGLYGLYTDFCNDFENTLPDALLDPIHLTFRLVSKESSTEVHRGSYTLQFLETRDFLHHDRYTKAMTLSIPTEIQDIVKQFFLYHDMKLQLVQSQLKGEKKEWNIAFFTFAWLVLCHRS